MATKSKSKAKAKQTEMPLKGKGVEAVTDKKLTALADEFVDLRDKKAELAENLTATEKKILDRMAELGIQTYRFADQTMRIEPGKVHVKIKKVKVEGNEPAGEVPGAENLGDATE